MKHRNLRPGDVIQQLRGGSLYYVRPDGTIDDSRANGPLNGSPIRLVVRDGQLVEGWSETEAIARIALGLLAAGWAVS